LLDFALATVAAIWAPACHRRRALATGRTAAPRTWYAADQTAHLDHRRGVRGAPAAPL